MAICPAKRFAPELIRVYEASVLKKLVSGTVGEVQQLKDSPDIPACVRLLVNLLLSDIEAGRLDALFILTVKLQKSCYADTIC
jgi:hypothetical protein